MTNFEYITSDKQLLASVLEKQHDTDYEINECENCVAYDYCVAQYKKTTGPVTDCVPRILSWLNEGVEL